MIQCFFLWMNETGTQSQGLTSLFQSFKLYAKKCASGYNMFIIEDQKSWAEIPRWAVNKWPPKILFVNRCLKLEITKYIDLKEDPFIKVSCSIEKAEDLGVYLTEVWFGLVGFYGILTIVGYFMSNTLYTYILKIYDLVWFGFYGILTIVGYFMSNTLYTYILDIYDLVWFGLGFMEF